MSGVLDSGDNKHSIYTTFSKAFDGVNHKISLDKLRLADLGGSLLSWIGSYLSERSQIVKVKGFKFRVMGVPQGSHLGPLLFNIFINDIHSCFQYSKFLCFADDLKCFMAISSTIDCINLQSDLSRFLKASL